jgi:thiol-disulfide isomerase/thioredoxin
MTRRISMTLVKWAAVIMLAVVLAGAALSCDSFTPSEAPDFTLSTMTGANITLSELRGSPVVLNFWSTSCSACRSQLPYFEDVALQSDEVVVLTISVGDSNSTLVSFFNGYEPVMIVALDTDGATFVNYSQSFGNSRGYVPFMLFLDGDGIVQQMRIGAFGSEAELWNTLHDLLGVTIPSAS